jgi:hypothetical protein
MVMTRKAPTFLVIPSDRGCPPNADDIAEAYWMGLLPTSEIRTFEAHCAHCEHCGEVSAQAHDFVKAFQHAAKAAGYSRQFGFETSKYEINTTGGAEAGRKYTTAAAGASSCPRGAAALERLREEKSRLDAAIAELENQAAPSPVGARGKLLVMRARP